MKSSKRDCAIALPALHDAANAASVRSQKRYLSLVKANLVALVFGAIAGAVSLPSGPAGRQIAAVAALALVTALILTFVIENKEYERTWYGGRAVAESVKTLAWRYMVRGEPFELGEGAQVDDLFLKRLKQILEQSATLKVGILSDHGDQITSAMREARLSSLIERRDLYTTCRIIEQREWYSRRSRVSEVASQLFFTAVWVTNIVAVAVAIAIVVWPTVRLNATGVFSTAAAALFAWLQVRRHQELAQAYAITAHELGLIQAKAVHIRAEQEFAEFVADAEAAISREHTLWVARRDAEVRFGPKPRVNF